jgi:serine/threonine protein kinase
MQPEEMVGQTLGHYRILRPLGYGGSAAVFLALDINLQREVAVKVFQPAEGEAQDFLRRFVREARVLAQLDHPNILPIYDYGEQDYRAFLVVPYMAGGSLREWLRGRGPVPPQQVMQLVGQALNALQYAHDRGLIHRDIKPGNMLFKADGTLLLADFGLVKVTAAQGTMLPLDTTRSMTTHTITGTPEYMAPEQINGQVVPTSDIYAMGVILYEMLTAVRPFTAETYMAVLMRHLYEQPQPMRALNPRISHSLEAVVMRALEKDPARRYQQPVDLRRDLEQAIAEEQVETAPTPALPPAGPTSPNSPPLAPVASAAQLPQVAYQATPITPSRQAPTSLADPGLYSASARPAPVRRSRSLLIGLLILVLLVATGLGGVLYGRGAFGPRPGPLTGTPGPGPSQPAATGTGGTPGGAAGGATAITPPVLTSCPAAGTARAAVMPPLAQQGNHQVIVYITNEGTMGNPTAGSLERFDVTAHQGVEITRLPSSFIREAQVSQNGQWALFSVKIAGQYELRMVRMDGQEMQTLYCAPSNADIFGVQWSFDQKSVIFDVGPHLPVAFLLNVASGKLQQELASSGNVSYVARTWLDNTHVYMVSLLSDTEAPPQSQDLYILDTGKGANQQSGSLQKIATISPACGSFDTSYNSTKLLISSCSGSASGAIGPSKITAQPATGGTTTTIVTIPQAVTALRSVTPTTLLLLIENASGDTSQNGLWKMNADGTGQKRLTTDSNNTQSLCQFTQYSWSNVSPDSTMYALQSYDPKTQTYRIYYGLLNGGPVNEIIASTPATPLLLVGWTNL